MTRSEFLTLQLAALDALDRKELCRGGTDLDGRWCAFMTLMCSSPPGADYYPFSSEVMRENDRPTAESPAARFVRVRKWVAAQLGGHL